MEKICEKIRLVRTSRGLKQQDICNIIKITKPAYSNIERGITDLNFSRLEQIAQAFKLTPAELMTYPESGAIKQEAFEKEVSRCKDELNRRDMEIIELQKMVSDLMNTVIKLKTELLRVNH